DHEVDTGVAAGQTVVNVVLIDGEGARAQLPLESVGQQSAVGPARDEPSDGLCGAVAQDDIAGPSRARAEGITSDVPTLESGTMEVLKPLYGGRGAGGLVCLVAQRGAQGLTALLELVRRGISTPVGRLS